MNSSAAQSPLASLMMSLGGSIELNSLNTTTDGAPALSEFSSLLQDLTQGQLQMLTPEGEGMPGLMTAEGEALPSQLPLVLPLSVSVSTAVTADADAEVQVESDFLMKQIETPPDLSLRHMPADEDGTGIRPVTPRTEENDDSQAFADLPDEEEQEEPQLMAVAPLTQAIQQASQQGTDIKAPVSSQRGNGAAKPNAESATSVSAALQAEDIDTDLADSELGGGDIFRPVTASDEMSLKRPLSDASGQSTLMTQTPSAQVASAGTTQIPTAGITTVNAETAQALSTTDASDAVDLEAAESFEQKLQTQLKERIEFGQDRREWGSALGARVLTMVADNIQQARIQIDPPELGSLEIKLHITQDQASVQVQAQNHQVKDVLEANVQRLRDALNEQGLELAGFDVGTSGQGASDQSSGGQGQNDSGGEWLADSESEAAEQRPVTRSNALLDTFA